MTDSERAFVLKVLQQKKALLEVLGPATERPALARWQIAALEQAARELSQPHFVLNPFV